MATSPDGGSDRMHHVFVISDLHIGGAPGTENKPCFQMCPPQARRRLAHFVYYVAKFASESANSRSVELVINGDFIDFLAEEPFQAFTGSPADAVRKLQSVIRSCDEDAPLGQQVFPALRQFVSQGHELTILLGNHDVELALPMVRRALLSALSNDRPSRVQFLLDGEAYVRGDVLIEHGNRYDGWNAVAHGKLRAFRSSASRGESPWPFQPPAGSRLVETVMNPLKKRYKFIDLLKPENETAVPILLALEPDLVTELRKLVPLWFSKREATGATGRVREEETYIAQTRAAQSRVSGDGMQIASLSANIESLAGDYLGESTRMRTEEILTEGEIQLSNLEGGGSGRVSLEESAIADGVQSWLSSKLSLWRTRAGISKDRIELLSHAFARYRRTIGTTFELDSIDPPYHDAATRLSRVRGTRVVIFGHTHLPKAISLEGGGLYLNTGTWCPTIRLDPKFYAEEPLNESGADELRGFVDDLAQNRVKKWIRLETHFAHIKLRADGSSTARLCRFEDDGSVNVLSEGLE